MKIRIAIPALVLLAATTVAEAEPIVEERTWTERYPVSAETPTLKIANIWGTVRVRAGTTDEIVVTVDERRTAPDAQLFERSLNFLSLDIRADQNGVSIVVGNPEERWRDRDSCRSSGRWRRVRGFRRRPGLRNPRPDRR